MRQVIKDRHEVTISEATKSKGYIMKGNKGDYLLAMDSLGRFIWVRLNPPKITKVVNAYDTLQEALEDKISQGYEVYEIDEYDV